MKLLFQNSKHILKDIGKIRSIRVNEKEEGDTKGKEEWAQMMGRASHCSNMRSQVGQRQRKL